ncbi:hypothetical protein ACFVR2_18790 [Gottfriedia sp. NPDC057991]|uniref:hypothetical protein n=1 Tax=Gottfriedia sp. NPDC057991 TaxID=3346298 RepID=UPI0036DA279A
MDITNEVLDKVFFKDGSFRDIYVLNVNLTEWQKCLDWIRTSTMDIVFYKDGEVTVYEETDVAYFLKDYGKLMAIHINGVQINCHFWSEDQIEFDVEPKEVKSITQAIGVFDFMRNLSKILGKESILTWENMPDWRLVTVKKDGTFLFNI